ncbi:LuxR family transcriptional regulator [Mycobacterium montefiorense]|uniref:LuxR family transcriptional regulator n=1 Tax=Mycobacterium montefiorense TaxID=154654 RepID=A0ABQ0NMG1_9MYCO|nr:LuxR family transcriptional regulator [Mycobacterium montefiorense]GKU33792.1 LuxR family transcriptional regulator [Mycobacterium montefiorense]GKU39912.1 LuxR family transcriptional regulator [Mycobacterium montefiorense]GKU43717.1 LuxR family transcriptional regulator [Mycobacterium montefiorense]GKU56219.1 LuxR family transcriptional regulator [Mycobacterium montefiorense]
MFPLRLAMNMSSMRGADGRVCDSLSECFNLEVGELVPTGTVTLLLADVEASTRLWDLTPGEMAAAIGVLDRALSEAVAAHRGVRPVEQGEGDSFVVAFARASDAVACALTLQIAPLAPIRLRIGVHTGEAQLRGDANYVGPTINRAARVRDLAHGGQTVLSGTTADLVVDHLPADAWLTDLGRHHLRDLPRPERVVQLCHPDLPNEFPPLRTTNADVVHGLPVQQTSFVGRSQELSDVRQLLANSRIITLTGAGGIGKTRLAQKLSAELAAEFCDGVWYVDLAPISAADIVAATVVRVLGLADQPGRAGIDHLAGLVGSRHMLIVLDNCEHLLDACAALVDALLPACPRMTLLATSREPLGVTGEVISRVPSLQIADEAQELFADRAALARPDFRINDDNVADVVEICRRLDGIALAIELAAARVRAMSLAEILDGLHDRFRLLTGGARTAVRRQQTLRASVDWSHALLTQPEQVLFRRLAVFLGGFNLDAAQLVAGAGELERHQVLDQLSLLVDKSLVVAEDHRRRTRYRLLETVRQYAQERLADSGEADAIGSRHRDYYSSLAAEFNIAAPTELERNADQAELEIDNMRAAFGWALDHHDPEAALALASFLQPLWRRRGRIKEGLTWIDVALAGAESQGIDIAPATRIRALTDRIMLTVSVVDPGSKDVPAEALALAREMGEPALLLKALTAWCCVSAYSGQAATESFTEAVDLARSLGDLPSLSQILLFRAFAALFAGDAGAERAAAQEGLEIAEAIGDEFLARHCRWNLGMALLHAGDLDGAAWQFGEVIAGADECQDPVFSFAGRYGRSMALAFRGESAAARDTAAAVVELATELGGFMEGFSNAALAVATLAAGDLAVAIEANDIARQQLSQRQEFLSLYANPSAEVALAHGDLAAARRHADEAVRATSGWNAAMALTVRARIAAAQGDFVRAEHDAHDALACVSRSDAELGVAGTLECLGAVLCENGSGREATRLLGSADALRDRTGEVRFAVYESSYQASVAVLRDMLGDNDFTDAWAEGAALTTEEAIAYAQRGRGGRKRPSSGWAAVTPTEREVVKLVSDGLANKDIAKKLFISPRTVQVHLNHVYRKLGLSSRVQLAKDAARQL